MVDAVVFDDIAAVAVVAEIDAMMRQVMDVVMADDVRLAASQKDAG